VLNDMISGLFNCRLNFAVAPPVDGRIDYICDKIDHNQNRKSYYNSLLELRCSWYAQRLHVYINLCFCIFLFRINIIGVATNPAIKRPMSSYTPNEIAAETPRIDQRNGIMRIIA